MRWDGDANRRRTQAVRGEMRRLAFHRRRSAVKLGWHQRRPPALLTALQLRKESAVATVRPTRNANAYRLSVTWRQL